MESISGLVCDNRQACELRRFLMVGGGGGGVGGGVGGGGGGGGVGGE